MHDKRNASIVKGRDAGITWRKLAEKHHLSPERCRQIYLRHLRKNEPERWSEWLAGYMQRSQRYRKREIEATAKRMREHEIRLRYFDREEPAETIAADVGWTMEQMQAFIEDSRAQRWVTATEYEQYVEAQAQRLLSGMVAAKKIPKNSA